MTLTFGECMLIARRRRGYDQKSLAQLCDVGHSYLCMVELDQFKGGKIIGSAMLRRRIMEVLDMPEIFALCEEFRKERAA